MIFKTLYIKNFRSYYEENRFDFNKTGLTLIIGGNGDGKTTFFEALQWLCNTTFLEQDNKIVNFSEMKKSQLAIGDTAEIKVKLDFYDDGDKSIEKSFLVTRDSEDKYSTSQISFLGYESDGIDRTPVEGGGEILIKRYYDSFIRRFSLFKGESELKVFNDSTALKQLVDTFSNVKEFDKMAKMADSFEHKSNKQYLTECTHDNKVSIKAKEIQSQLDHIDEIIRSKKKEISSKQESIFLYTEKLSDLEQAKESSEKYNEITKILKSKEDDARRLKAQTERTNFNTALLDKLWILCAYTPVLQDFQRKVSALSKEKRTQEKDFIAQKNKELGKIEAQEEIMGALQNGTAPLPWYLPDEETMEEMLQDGICKVCGRPVEKGTEAYEFMTHKLNDYRNHVKAELLRKKKRDILENKELFISHYIEDLHNLSIYLGGNRAAEISQITNDINDEMSYIAYRREDLKKVVAEIQEFKAEKTRLLIKTGIPEDVFKTTFSNIKGLFDQKEEASKRLVELESDLKEAQNNRKDKESELNELDPSNSQVKKLREVHRILDLISKAFNNAKDKNLTEFIRGLEDEANINLAKLGRSDFHGRVHIHRAFNKDGNTILIIQLVSSNGAVIQKMSGSQETLMYISVLFAIRDFTQNKRGGGTYPLIFDAATSSFGDEKEEDFYEVFGKIDNQCIIATKDFLHHNKLDMDAINNIEGKVYRIYKDNNYNDEDLSTIRTIIKEIK